MEAAPLTRAHAHASKATHQQTLHNFKLASEEHKEAAEEFERAEKETEDPESASAPYYSASYSNFVSFGGSVQKLALRTLALLQQHHRDLSSRLLASTVQTPPTPPPNQTSFSTKESSTMAKPVTTTATTFSPPTSPKHRPPPLFGPDSGKPESPKVEKPKMFFQPSTPTTPNTSDNPTHPSGTKKIAPPPIPLPSPTNITTQTLTYTSMRDGPVIPSPNPFALANELANARGIRSPVRGRSPATTGNDRNFLQVREPEPGARAASAGGTVRGTSPVLLNAPPKKDRRKSAGAASPVVAPREGLPFDSFSKPAGEGPIRPAVKEYDSSQRSTSPNPPPKTDEAFTKFYSQFEEYIEAVGNPLAFAGLPLDGDLSSMDPALRKAVAEKGAAESFYVVPTTGGTMSYAGILTRNQQQLPSEKGEAATLPAAIPKPVDTPPVSNKTREELELENTQLRQLTDIMAHKLHTWETSAKVNAAKMRESLQVLKETNHTSPITDGFDSDRGIGKSRGFGRSREPLKLGGGKTETQVLTLPDRASDLDMPSTPRLAPRTLTLPGRPTVDEYEPPKTPRFGGGFPKDFDDDKPAKSNRAVSPNPSGKSRGLSPLPSASKPRALSPAPSVLSDNPTMDELQAEVARLRQHETKILKENDKLKTVVGKYRDRWEKLKEGARARRAEQEAGDDTESIKSEATEAKSKITTKA
ncbi:hypothetical protein TWF694_002577 [Orbilia ellipsospora]|uniref:Uncharacterized protein n=2 Tax=Orbilia ellipsospora TaxID=2528407 RepID=A0AAV9X3M4_9PEZI